jgi:hypothetical protein
MIPLASMLVLDAVADLEGSLPLEVETSPKSFTSFQIGFG